MVSYKIQLFSFVQVLADKFSDASVQMKHTQFNLSSWFLNYKYDNLRDLLIPNTLTSFLYSFLYSKTVKTINSSVFNFLF